MKKRFTNNYAIPGNMPLITVIIVVYNAANSLEETILSVINQTYANTELCIIDGGSTDGTLDIIKKYDSRITYWVSEADKGIYDAMNKGITVAKGDWIYFLGSGDILLNVLHKIAGLMTDERCIYYGNVYRNDLKKVFNGRYSAYKLAVTNICHQAIFYPLNVLRKHNYNIYYKSLADHDLNMRCFGDKTLRFKYLPELISIYEGNGFSEENQLVDPFLNDKLKIIQSNFSFLVYIYAYLRTRTARLIKPGYLKK
ncbi:glycosyltransferase [Mucilaginibacter limnophilus]|uniref:Glycosyltransferase n=1 Tax=Mucilaginibacter limnophilus TaxID=1932778 RepID=A0A437MTF0_9SPHI|nr:glycosyltransferase family 2 protein [Mucilaginibacter limnophilus]RVU00929.1 glycosyltransferase [Mucilaginibacter limnophilus]